MNQKKSRFERYLQNGTSIKLQENPPISIKNHYQQRSSLNHVLNGNLTFDCQNVEQKYQKKMNEKLICLNKYSLWNLIAYYFIRIIQSLSDNDRQIQDLIYFILMFLSILAIQIAYIIMSKKQNHRQQYTIFFTISCIAYINILSWQRIYINTNSPSCKTNYKTNYENLDFLLNEYQIIFLMLYYMKWIWKCVIVVAVTILQSVLIFDEKYSQSLGIILMIIQIVSFYVSEYTNRNQFIQQNQKYRNLKQLVEIMNTKLPIGVAIFQKKDITSPFLNSQLDKHADKNKGLEDSKQMKQIIFPTARRNIQSNLQSDKEIRSLKVSLQQIISPKPKDKNLKVQIDSSIGVPTESKDDLNVDIRFINTMLFQQVFNTTGQQQAQRVSREVEDLKQRLSQINNNNNNNNNNQSSNHNNIKGLKKSSIVSNNVNINNNNNNNNDNNDNNKYQILNGVMTDSNNLFTRENQNTEGNFNNNQITQNDHTKDKKSNSFNIKDSNTLQSVHAFLESLQVPQRASNNINKADLDTQKQFDVEDDSIGFYTNFAEMKSQQNSRISGQKTNFKQLIKNFFQFNELDNVSSSKFTNFDKIYFNCQQTIERPRMMERKETKSDVRTKNGTEENQKQYDIKITSVILNGEPALILMINDSTDRFIMQQMKESSEFKSQLLNYIQHIAKTPLNSIIQLSETMEQWFPLQPNNKQICNDIKDNLDIIKKNGLILHHQVQSIIDLQQINCNSKISLKTDIIDLNTVIREVQELFQSEIEAKNIKFEIIQDEEVIEMQTDENRLTQILIEMIGNSVKFTREHDTIKIDIQLQKTYAVSLISISIIDTGTGMSPEQVAIINSSASWENMHLPNTHFRQGPGIGLEVSRKLIGLLGPFSKFNLKSTAGEGSQFKFWLYLNLNEKEFAEKSNKMMRKTSDLILEKKEMQSFDKFVISNRLQHMEIMVDPFSLHPQMMYSNKDLNHFLQTRRSSKQSAHSSYSPKHARTTEGGQPQSSVHSYNQLSSLQNQFLIEQQLLQTQIMKKRSLYRVNSPQIVIRKRDLTMNTYISDQQKSPLIKYLNPNNTTNASNINESNNIDLNNVKTSSPKNSNTYMNNNILNNQTEQGTNQAVENSIALVNGQIKQKTNMSLPSDNLDPLLIPFRQFGRQHTLQMKSNPNSKFQRSNRKFLSNSYQINIGSHSNILSPCLNNKYTYQQHSQQSINLQASKDICHKNHTAYFSQALENNSNNNNNIESYFKQSPKRSIQTKTGRSQIQRCFSHEEQFTQSLKLTDLVKSTIRNKDFSKEEEEEEDILDEEKEGDDEEEEEFEDDSNLEEQESNLSHKDVNVKQGKRKIKREQESNLSSSLASHNLIQNSKLYIDKQYLINSNLSQLYSQNHFDELDELNQNQITQQIRSFNVKSNLNMFTPDKMSDIFSDSICNRSLRKQEQFKSQFTFNTIKHTNVSRHSLQSIISNQQDNEEKQSIVSLRSNKVNRSYEKSQYHSLTNISSSQSPPNHQTPRMKKRHDQIIEIKEDMKANKVKPLAQLTYQNISKAKDLQNTLFKITLEDYNQKNNKSCLVLNKDPNAVVVQKVSSPPSGISFKLPREGSPNKSILKEVRVVNNMPEKEHNTSHTKQRGDDEFSITREEEQETNHQQNKKRKAQNSNKNSSSDGQNTYIIESLDSLMQDKGNQSKDDSKDAPLDGNQLQSNKQKRRLKNQSTFENSHFNIINKINVLDNEQVHSSQVLDDQKQQIHQKGSINTTNNTPSQQPRQLHSNYQTVTSRSSLGNRQVRVTLNTIMSHDIDQDIFDTLFPQDTLLLIVDDTTFNRIVLKQMFKSSQNLIIHEAINGQDAIDKIKILKETTNRTYSLIFMDLNMPIMDGFEALKQIQTLIKQSYIKWVPVVAVTAYDTEVENCRNKGFDGFISKPIRIKEMVRTLIRIISLRKVEEH